MKLTLILIAFCLCGSIGYSQDWQKIKTTQSLIIFAKEIHFQDETNGIDHQRIVFKYENTTSAPIEVALSRELTYDGEVATQENNFSIHIPANTALEYNDSKSHNKTYYIFKKDNEDWIKRTLDTYKIIHLKIEKL